MTDFYTSTEDDLSVVTDLDLELIDHVPDERFPWLLWSFVKVRQPNENGLPQKEEELTLHDLRHELIHALHENLQVVYAGSRLVDGWLELYFYAPSPKRYENIVTQTMGAYKEYAHESGSRRDAKWEQYLRTLYPDARQFQQIQSRHTILALSEEGDDLTLERPVEHYIFFKTRSNEERFSDKALEMGFTLKEQVEQDDETYPYGVVLERAGAVTFEATEACIDMLFAEVLKEHGVYEGWSTALAKEADV